MSLILLLVGVLFYFGAGFLTITALCNEWIVDELDLTGYQHLAQILFFLSIILWPLALVLVLCYFTYTNTKKAVNEFKDWRNDR